MVVTRHAQQAACDAQKKNLRRFCSQVISERRPLVEMTSERRDKEGRRGGEWGGHSVLNRLCVPRSRPNYM